MGNPLDLLEPASDLCGYDRIKQLKRDLRQQGVKVNIPDLLALARNNDPFYAGAPACRVMAEWCTDQLDAVGLLVPGVHLRRVHYRLVSQNPPPLLWTGVTYQNDSRSWQCLNIASKAARYLKLVDVEMFDDHRNPDPLIVMAPQKASDPPAWKIPTDWIEWDAWLLPEIQIDLADDLDWSIPEPEVSGYTYSMADQPVVVEVWIEKSTQEDWLKPLCRRWGVNYVSGIGFQSITGAINALKRLDDFNRQANPKPLRIFYLSDFDPAGVFMPDGTARQLEYWVDQFAPGADIRLTPLGLTYEQVKEFKLPTIPIKETDKRMENFKKRYEVDGGVELDALEALYPGTMTRIVTEAIRPFRDNTLPERLRDAEEAATEAVNAAWADSQATFEDRLENLKLQGGQILEQYRQQLETLSGQLIPFTDRLYYNIF